VSDTADASLLGAMLNMTEFHHEHEKFYSVSPREQAVTLQRHSRTLHALADRWTAPTPTGTRVTTRYAGASDLNAPVATQLDGVLFMEGEGEPSEITQLKRDLRLGASDARGAGEWLGAAMQSNWDLAPVLFDIGELADLLGERHRIIANNWQSASVMTLVGHVLDRAADLLDHIDFTPTSLRADLAGPAVSTQHVYAAGEMIDHASDLLGQFATLVHDNERRWRVFHARLQEIIDDKTMRRPAVVGAESPL
jgi:hypothetical protein